MISMKKITEISKIRGEEFAIVSKCSGITWSQFRDSTESKVTYLINRYSEGFPSQVCYISNNRLDIFPWLAAFSTLSIPFVGIDYTLPIECIQKMIENIGADFIILSSGFLGKSAVSDILMKNNSKSRFILDIDSPSLIAVDSIGCTIKHRNININETGFHRSVSFTSGTTNSPKAVLRTKSFDERRFQYFTSRYGFNEKDRFMVSMPLYHAAGNGWARLFLSIGATLYLLDGDDVLGISETLDNHSITATVLSPILLSSIIQYRNNAKLQKSGSLKWVLVGGRNFTEVEKKQAISYFGPVVYEYYGTTETGVNTIAEPEDLQSHPASVGKVYDGNDIKILGENNEILGLGEVGCVCICSYMNMSEYVGFDAPFIILNEKRYFISQDSGYLDQEGRLFLTNRTGIHGRKTSLYQLENSLRRLPCIKDIAFLQEQGGIVRCVYTTSITQEVDKTHLLMSMKKIAKQRHINLVECKRVNNIPYSPSGKVRVHELNKLLDIAREH